MKNSALISVALFSLICANGPALANRTATEAQTIAKKTLPNALSITLSDVKTEGADTLYYTFKGANGGFAVISAKEQTPALLVYNKNQHLTEKEAEHLEEFLSTYFKNMGNLQLKREGKVHNADGLKVSKMTGCAIEPLLGEISWGQLDPYDFGSPSIDGEVAPTGCVATAIGQIMKYYNYPAATTEAIPGYITSTESIKMPYVEKGTAINWNEILEKYIDGYSYTNGMEVSKLLSIVGKAMMTDYMKGQSASGLSGVLELPRYFGYDADLIRIAYRSSFTLEEWYDLIYSELKEKRPVMFSGSTMKSGHRFICDGVDNDGMFHINWGWEGEYDGYYDLTLLNPNTNSMVGASSSNDGYTRDDAIIIGITPDNGIKDERTSTNVISTQVEHKVVDGKHQLLFTYANPYTTDTQVYLATGYIDENGKVVKVNTEMNAMIDAAKKYQQTKATPINTSNFEEGKFYKLGLIESTNRINWTPCEGYKNVSITFTVKNGELVIVNGYELEAEITSIDYNNIGHSSYLVIDLKNNGEKEYYGDLYLMTNSMESMPKDYSYAAAVTVEAKNTNTMEAMFTAKSDTTYYWLVDKEENIIKNGFWVKGNKKYELAGKLTVDTIGKNELNQPVTVFSITLTNSGDAIYCGDIAATVTDKDGYTTNRQNVTIKPGETKEYRVKTECRTFTYYVLTDYNNNHIAFGELERKENENDLGINFYNVYPSYNNVGDTLKGFIIIMNHSKNKHNFDVKVTINEEKNGTEEEVGTTAVQLDPLEIELVDYSVVTPTDSFYFNVYINDDFLFSDVMSRTITTVSTTLADQPISIEVIGQTIYATALKNCQLDIYTVTGAHIVNRSLAESDTFSQQLKPGIYIVNGKKILIR